MPSLRSRSLNGAVRLASGTRPGVPGGAKRRSKSHKTLKR